MQQRSSNQRHGEIRHLYTCRVLQPPASASASSFSFGLCCFPALFGPAEAKGHDEEGFHSTSQQKEARTRFILRPSCTPFQFDSVDCTRRSIAAGHLYLSLKRVTHNQDAIRRPSPRCLRRPGHRIFVPRLLSNRQGLVAKGIRRLEQRLMSGHPNSQVVRAGMGGPRIRAPVRSLCWLA